MVLSGVGNTLREERLRRQFSLEHVSNVTRISVRYLDAIENARSEDLPEIVFTRGFVRQYAAFLGLPAEDLLAMLPKVDIESAALPVAPVKERRRLWNPRWNLPAMGLGVAAVAMGAVGGAWIYFDLTPVVAAAAKAAVSAVRSQQAAKGQAAAKTASVAQSGPARAMAAQEVQPTEAAPASAVKAEAGQGQPMEERAGPDSAVVTSDVPAGTVQVLLRANSDAWVQVVSDGKKAFTGMLHRNDSRVISGNQLVRVMTGNAGGLEISLNGRILEPLGPEGQVRTVRLTADGLVPEMKSAAQAGVGPI